MVLNILLKMETILSEKYSNMEKTFSDQQNLLIEQQKIQEQRHDERQRMAFVELLEFQSNTRKKAELEWEKLPDERKFVKKLFRKEENWKDRDKFINEYIEKETLYWLNKKEIVNDTE